MPREKYKSDRHGKIARLVRFSVADAERIRAVSQSLGMSLVTFYGTAATAYLAARAEQDSPPLTPTPTGVPFEILTVRLDPEIFEELGAVALRDGVHVGRILATATYYGTTRAEPDRGSHQAQDNDCGA